MTVARAKAEGKPDPAKRTEPREVKETAERECHTSRLGDNGRQMNPSTQRAVPGIQAGRQRETNKGRQRETNESVHPQRWETNEGRPRETSESVRLESRDRPPGWETTGAK